MANSARMVSLILSDVIGSPLDVIASGPTVPDPTTYADALAVLERAGILEQTPASILAVLQAGQRGEISETLKPGDPRFAQVTNTLVASNPQAAAAALEQARAEGFNALLLTTSLQGEASQVGAVLASVLQQINASGQPVPRPACIIAGGETTVTIRGSGRGGRNQELALGAAFLLDGLPGVALVSLATDGEDGPTDAAGALVTGETLARARHAGLDPRVYLLGNDSYVFFQSLGDLLITGPTGTNVNDLVFLFAF
jgi:hydroxypyruvate reductase